MSESPLQQNGHDFVLSASPSRSLTLATDSVEEMELARILRSCLSPAVPQFRPQSLHDLCIRTAAVYATTSLYEFHDKRSVAENKITTKIVLSIISFYQDI